MRKNNRFQRGMVTTVNYVIEGRNSKNLLVCGRYAFDVVAFAEGRQSELEFGVCCLVDGFEGNERNRARWRAVLLGIRAGNSYALGKGWFACVDTASASI